jgi:hypothetical protein
MPRPRNTKSTKKKLTTSNITALFFLQDRTQNHTQTKKKNKKNFKKKNFRQNGIKEQKTRRKTSIKRATRQKADAAAEKHTSK